MNKKFLSVLSFLAIISLNGFSQDIPKCYQHKMQQKMLQENPHLAESIEHANQQLELEEMQRGGDDDTLIIPVVFHVIHDYGPENISDEQIINAVEILNRDFRKMNADTSFIHEEFADLASDIKIEFRLAQLDPDGNCTKGITRTVSDLTYEGDDNMRELIQWPRDSYMNVWVCNYANGAAGYTFIPAFVDNFFAQGDDGIVLKHDYTGAIGTGSVGRSRTLTHEVGHWLNLRHTWGPTNDPGEEENCETDDGVEDTPLTRGWTTCNVNGESCGSLDNVENYMEYSYCSKMFTPGQKHRMRTAAMSDVADRSNLSTEENLILTGVINDAQLLCEAEFEADIQVICEGGVVSFSDESYNDVDYWIWDFGDGTIIEGAEAALMQDPEHVYTEAGIYDVTLTVSKDGAIETETKTAFVHVIPEGSEYPPVIEGFEDGFPEGEWFVIGENDNINWEVTSDAAYSGSQSIYLNNRNAVPQHQDELISATIDTRELSDFIISFKYAYANRSEESSDALRVFISGDCGETWTLRTLRRGDTNLDTADPVGSNFVPEGNGEWDDVSFTVIDSSFHTEHFMVRFQFTGNGGNNIYLDDINIAPNFISVEETEESSLNWSLYPNPAEENTTLDLGVKVQGEYNIVVRDVTGRSVMNVYSGNLTAGEHKFELPVTELRNGMYMITLENESGRYTKRLLVSH